MVKTFSDYNYRDGAGTDSGKDEYLSLLIIYDSSSASRRKDCLADQAHVGIEDGSRRTDRQTDSQTAYGLKMA